MRISDLHRSIVIRGGVLLLLYALVLSASWWLAYELRFDFAIPDEFRARMRAYWGWTVLLKLVLLWLFGQFAGLLSYFSIPDLRRIFYASFVSSACLFVAYYSGKVNMAPRGVILMDFLLSFT